MSDPRETLRCAHCGLNQFVAASRLCRRCRQPIELPPVPEPPPVPAEPKVPRAEAMPLHERIQKFRRTRLLSQSQLAARMKVPRTYISKLECGHAVPTLSSLKKIADALKVPLVELLGETPIAVPTPTSPFLAELSQYIPHLSALEMRSILNVAEKLARVAKERAA